MRVFTLHSSLSQSRGKIGEGVHTVQQYELEEGQDRCGCSHCTTVRVRGGTK